MNLRNEYTEAVWLRDRWLEQYGEQTPGMAGRLRALPPVPTPDEVDAAFSGWAGLGKESRVQREFTCDECGGTSPQVIRLGEEPDYESRTADICAACLVAAPRLVDGE